MNTAKHKNWLLLALLIFVGQVVAKPFSGCQMKMDTAQSSMQSMQHAMSDMNMTSVITVEKHMNMPCCGDKCDCPDGICMGFVMIASPLFNIQMPNLGLYSVSINPFHITQTSSAIFHPPILS